MVYCTTDQEAVGLELHDACYACRACPQSWNLGSGPLVAWPTTTVAIDEDGDMLHALSMNINHTQLQRNAIGYIDSAVGQSFPVSWLTNFLAEYLIQSSQHSMCRSLPIHSFCQFIRYPIKSTSQQQILLPSGITHFQAHASPLPQARLWPVALNVQNKWVTAETADGGWVTVGDYPQVDADWSSAPFFKNINKNGCVHLSVFNSCTIV